jgi:hypothetical protein
MHVRDEEEIRLVMFEHVGWIGSEAERVSRVANLQLPRSTHSQVHRSVPKYSHTDSHNNQAQYVTHQDSTLTYAQ